MYAFAMSRDPERCVLPNADVTYTKQKAGEYYFLVFLVDNY